MIRLNPLTEVVRAAVVLEEVANLVIDRHRLANGVRLLLWIVKFVVLTYRYI
jgi:hypothetical protein